MNDFFCVYYKVQQISPVINNTKTYVTADSVLQLAVFTNVIYLLVKPIKLGKVRLGSVSFKKSH
jgi:hypothetical protein